MLPSGNVLTVDAYVADYPNCPTGSNPFRSELYNPGTGSWSDAGSTVVKLPDCGPPNQSFELGPQILRPDGTVVAFGGTTSGVANTAIYNSSTGTWSAGPALPVIGAADYNLADAPAALLNNGNILFAASPGLFSTPVHFFEFSSANAITQVGDTTNAPSLTSYQVNFVVLPTGQVLETDFSGTVEIYQANGGFNASWQPTITSVPSNLALGATYQVSGTQLSGLSQGAAYGDDAQANTNFPLVIIENIATAHTFYARTTNWSTTSVAPGASGSVSFTVPSNMEIGPSLLFVIADGIFSAPSNVTISKSLSVTHDFNGDGRSDILWRDSAGDVGMWLMNGGQILLGAAFNAVATNWSIVGQRDFNGDGKSDILWRDTVGDVGMWLMNGTQIVQGGSFSSIPLNWSVAGTGDFNGDGKADILWIDNQGNVGIWFMNGTQILQAGVVGQLPPNWIIVGSDMKGDIFLRNISSGDVGMWVMNGNHIAQSIDFGPVSLNWTVAGIGDFDGNGSFDLLWRDTAGDAAIWLMNGTSITSTKVLGNLPTSWNIAETGDFNGDGRSDVLWVDNTGNVGIWFMNGTSVSSVVFYGSVGTNWAVQSLGAD